MLRFCLYIRPADLFSSQRVNKCWATGNNWAAAESPSHCVMWVSGPSCSATDIQIHTRANKHGRSCNFTHKHRPFLQKDVSYKNTLSDLPHVTQCGPPGLCGHLHTRQTCSRTKSYWKNLNGNIQNLYCAYGKEPEDVIILEWALDMFPWCWKNRKILCWCLQSIFFITLLTERIRAQLIKRPWC